MALDWGFIRNVESKELTDAEAEVLYDQLIQYNPDGSESVEQLRQLFNVSRQVMQIKAIQVDVAIEELEEVISKESANQKANKSNLSDGDSTVVYGQQFMELKKTNELLTTQLNEKDVELNRLEQTKLNLEETLKLNERQLHNYSQEIEQLREELHIAKGQINEQLADHDLPFEQLRDMNKKFYMLLDEMKDMETMNNQLGETVNKLKKELDSATNQMQIATKEMEYMKRNLNNLQETNDMLINEKEDHLVELKRLKTLTSNYESESDKYLDSSSKKIHDLLEKLNQKEQEVNELKSQFELIGRKRLGEEKGHFFKEIFKRDNHIKLLRNQLSQAIDDIEAQNRVIENLIKKNIETIHKFDHSKGVETGSEDNQLNNSKQLIGKLEEELKAKDKEMTILHQRNTLYEQGIYGLSEAVGEINKLSKLIIVKDNEIESLVKELNSMNLKLSNMQDELDYLKEFLNADDELKKKLNEDSDVKNDKLKVLKLQKEVIRLDAEKLKLYEELLSYKFGSDPSKSTNKVGMDDLTELANQGVKENLKDIEQLQKLNSLQEMENENRELQLAMKEILIGLKESDSKSDIIIDCPSLERLCQFFESRSINSSLANVITLKAELDILRGHNEELRMTNKRLRNDIFKIFENYSKQLLIEFTNKHDSELEVKSSEKINGNIKLNNQILKEDEFYDLDLSEGEIVLSSINLQNFVPKTQQNQETQTDFDDFLQHNGEEHGEAFEAENNLGKNPSAGDSSINGFDVSSLVASQPEDGKTAELPAADCQSKKNIATRLNRTKDATSTNSSTEVSDQKMCAINRSFTENFTQTDLRLEDLEKVEFLDKINNLNIDELKKLIGQNDSIEEQPDSAKTDLTKQTIGQIDHNSMSDQDDKKCTQCNLLQNLLIEFQDKIDRIDSSVGQREDQFAQKMNVLQTELEKIIQAKDELLDQKDKQIVELNDQIFNQKEKVLNLEMHLKNNVENNEKKFSVIEKEISPANETTLDKETSENPLAIINKGPIDSINQRGLVNILETIVKCLQARIVHKDDAIAHYQQLLTKTQEEHQQEIQKLMKNYEKVMKSSMKAVQSSSNVNQEQLEITLTKYNEQLDEFKLYHQKVLAKQKKAFELQASKMKRIKNENERLKSLAGSTEELNRLRLENEQLNKMVKKNAKFIEKLKHAIKEERELKQNIKTDSIDRQEKKSKLLMINKLKEEVENLYKLLIDKDKQMKELQLVKWNLEKKIGEVTQTSKVELKAKSEELEKLISDKTRLKNQLEKLEKSRNALKAKPIIKKLKMVDKEVQTDKIVNFEDRSAMFIDKFKELDQTISTLKRQLQNCAYREKQLIELLETKGFHKNEVKEHVSDCARLKKRFSAETIKGQKFEIRKNSCDF